MCIFTSRTHTQAVHCRRDDIELHDPAELNKIESTNCRTRIIYCEIPFSDLELDPYLNFIIAINFKDSGFLAGLLQ